MPQAEFDILYRVKIDPSGLDAFVASAQQAFSQLNTLSASAGRSQARAEFEEAQTRVAALARAVWTGPELNDALSRLRDVFNEGARALNSAVPAASRAITERDIKPLAPVQLDDRVARLYAQRGDELLRYQSDEVAAVRQAAEAAQQTALARLRQKEAINQAADHQLLPDEYAERLREVKAAELRLELDRLSRLSRVSREGEYFEGARYFSKASLGTAIQSAQIANEQPELPGARDLLSQARDRQPREIETALRAGTQVPAEVLAAYQGLSERVQGEVRAEDLHLQQALRAAQEAERVVSAQGQLAATLERLNAEYAIAVTERQRSGVDRYTQPEHPLVQIESALSAQRNQVQGQLNRLTQSGGQGELFDPTAVARPVNQLQDRLFRAREQEAQLAERRVALEAQATELRQRALERARELNAEGDSLDKKGRLVSGASANDVLTASPYSQLAGYGRDTTQDEWRQNQRALLDLSSREVEQHRQSIETGQAILREQDARRQAEIAAAQQAQRLAEATQQAAAITVDDAEAVRQREHAQLAAANAANRLQQALTTLAANERSIADIRAVSAANLGIAKTGPSARPFQVVDEESGLNVGPPQQRKRDAQAYIDRWAEEQQKAISYVEESSEYQRQQVAVAAQALELDREALAARAAAVRLGPYSVQALSTGSRDYGGGKFAVKDGATGDYIGGAYGVTQEQAQAHADRLNAALEQHATGEVLAAQSAQALAAAEREVARRLLAVELVPIGEFGRVHTLNARQDKFESPQYLDNLRRQIASEGIQNPVVLKPSVNPLNNAQSWSLWDGNHRLQAAKELGLTHLPTVVSQTDEDFRQGNYERPSEHGFIGRQLEQQAIAEATAAETAAQAVQQGAALQQQINEARSQVREAVLRELSAGREQLALPAGAPAEQQPIAPPFYGPRAEGPIAGESATFGRALPPWPALALPRAPESIPLGPVGSTFDAGAQARVNVEAERAAEEMRVAEQRVVDARQNEAERILDSFRNRSAEEVAAGRLAQAEADLAEAISQAQRVRPGATEQDILSNPDVVQAGNKRDYYQTRYDKAEERAAAAEGAGGGGAGQEPPPGGGGAFYGGESGGGPRDTEWIQERIDALQEQTKRIRQLTASLADTTEQERDLSGKYFTSLAELARATAEEARLRAVALSGGENVQATGAANAARARQRALEQQSTAQQIGETDTPEVAGQAKYATQLNQLRQEQARLQEQLNTDLQAEAEGEATSAGISAQIRLLKERQAGQAEAEYQAMVEGSDVAQAAQNRINQERINAAEESAYRGLVTEADIQVEVANTVAQKRQTEIERLQVARVLLGEEQVQVEESTAITQIMRQRAEAEARIRTEAGLGRGGSGTGPTGLFSGITSGFSRGLGGGAGGNFLGGLGSQLGSFAAFTATTSLIFRLGPAIRNLVKDAEELERTMAAIHTQAEALGQGAGFNNFARSIFDTSRSTGVAATQVAALGQEFLGLYGNTAQAAVAMNDAATLIRVMGADATQAGPQIAALAEDLGVSVKDIGNTVIDIQDRTGRAYKDILSGLGQVAPVAQELNLSLTQTRALIEAVAVGSAKSGQAIGEGLARILPELQKNLPKLEQEGVTVSVQAKTGDAKAALEDLLTSYQHLSDQQRQLVISDLGGPRNAQILAAALHDPTKALQELNRTELDNNLLSERNRQQQETLAGATARFRQEMTALGQAILASGISRFLQDIFNLGSSVADVFVRLSETVRQWNGDLHGTLGVLGDFAIRFAEVLVAAKALSAIGLGGGIGGILGGAGSVASRILPGGGGRAQTAAAVQAAETTTAAATSAAEVTTAAADASAEATTTAAAAAAETTTGAAVTFAEIIFAAAQAFGEALVVFGGGVLAGATDAGLAMATGGTEAGASVTLGGTEAGAAMAAGGTEAGAAMAAGGVVGGAEKALGGLAGAGAGVGAGEAAAGGAVAGEVAGAGAVAAPEVGGGVVAALGGPVTLAIAAAAAVGLVARDLVKKAGQKKIDALRDQFDTKSDDELKKEASDRNFAAGWEGRVASDLRPHGVVGTAVGLGISPVARFIFGASTERVGGAARDVLDARQVDAQQSSIQALIEGGVAQGDDLKKLQEGLANPENKKKFDALEKVYKKLSQTPKGKQILETQRLVDERGSALRGILGDAGDEVQDLSQVQQLYQQGDITYGQLAQAYQEELKRLDSYGDRPDTRKEYLKDLTAYEKAQSDHAKLLAQSQLDEAEAFGQTSPENTIRIETNLLRDPHADQQTRLDAAKAIAKAQHDIVQRQLSEAKNIADIQAIEDNGVAVAPEVRAAFLAQDLTADEKWGTFLTNLKAIDADTTVTATNIATLATTANKSAKDAAKQLAADEIQTLQNLRRVLQQHGEDTSEIDAEIASITNAVNALPDIATPPPKTGLTPEQKAAADKTKEEKTRALAHAKIALDKAKAGDNQLTAATDELRDAQQSLQDVKDQGYGPESAEYVNAQAGVVTAQNNLAKAQRDYATALDNVDKARVAHDPISAALAALKTTNDAIAVATDPTAKANLLAQQIQDEGTVRDALNAYADSKITLLEAMASARGDDVAAAGYALQLLQEKRDQILSDPQGVDKTKLNDINGQIAQQQDSIVKTEISSAEQDIQTDLDLKRITTGQAVARLKALEAVERSHGATQRELDGIELEIRRLQSSSDQSLQFNLPQDVKLPTLYEVRRYNQSQQAGAGYNDNRQISVTLYINNGMDEAAAKSFLADAMSAPGSVYGATARRY